MANDLVNINDTIGAMEAINGPNGTNVFQDDAASHDVNENGLLRFSGNTGKWTSGGQEITGDQPIFAMDMMRAQRGWQAWKNNKPVASMWATIAKRETLPAENELDDHWVEGKTKETDGWRYVVKVPVRDLEGGPELSLILPAEKGYRPINRLLKRFGDQLKMNFDPVTKQYKIPCVTVGSESFDSKGGLKYAPVLEIESWMTIEELDEIVQSVEAVDGEVANEAQTVEVEEVKETKQPQTKKEEPKAATPAGQKVAGFRNGRVGARA